jgi:hypothetical protein
MNMAIQIAGSKMPTLASEQLKPSTDGYGQNGAATPSSVQRGDVPKNKMATPANDPVLDYLADPSKGKSALDDSSGTGNPVNDLLRKTGDNPTTPRVGMKSPNKPDEKIPTGGRPVTTRG